MRASLSILPALVSVVVAAAACVRSGRRSVKNRNQSRVRGAHVRPDHERGLVTLLTVVLSSRRIASISICVKSLVVPASTRVIMGRLLLRRAGRPAATGAAQIRQVR